ncbi:MAG TPA: BPL-N domain-containing protein [Rhabdochlamydiaceae bacterium]
MPHIFVYADQGVDGGGLKQLICSLKNEIDPSQHKIVRMDSKELISGEWEKEARLLIVPGGRDCFYHTSLDGKGTQKIRSFVEKGGGYLGICAGAYFAAHAIEFEKGHPLEVCGERSLKFFPGIAKGPVFGYNRYSYESAKGAEAAHISWKNAEKFHIYFNGGCTFEIPPSDLEVRVLSRYLDLDDQPPAILQIGVAKGLAILSGVHFEYNPSFFPAEDPHLAQISHILHHSETGRRKVFREIMACFGLHLAKEAVS